MTLSPLSPPCHLPKSEGGDTGEPRRYWVSGGCHLCHLYFLTKTIVKNNTRLTQYEKGSRKVTDPGGDGGDRGDTPLPATVFPPRIGVFSSIRGFSDFGNLGNPNLGNFRKWNENISTRLRGLDIAPPVGSQNDSESMSRYLMVCVKSGSATTAWRSGRR
jgi:hypothetical protein